MNVGQSIYFSNLDAWRFFAALAVMLFHMISRFVYADGRISQLLGIVMTFDGHGGEHGVRFFFVLSGFLISYLMMQEQDQTGRLDVGYFYMRRVLRIWPLYYLSSLIGFVLYPLFATPHFQEQASPLRYMFFLTNFDHIYFGWPQTGILGVQWSVAVEEQFYLIWPIIFILFGTRRFFPWLMAIIMAVSAIGHVMGLSYYHTITALADLSFGALLAYWAFYQPVKMHQVLGVITKGRVVAIYIVGLLLLLLDYKLRLIWPFYENIGRYLHMLFFGFIIVEQNFSEHSFFKFGRIKVFNSLGRVSYGLYLLHMVAVVIVMGLGVNRWWGVCLSLVLSILFAYGSYYGFERYFLRFRRRFDPLLSS